MALSRVVSEIFNMEKYRDLEIPVKSQSRLLKVVPFDRSGMVSYFQPHLKGVALKIVISVYSLCFIITYLCIIMHLVMCIKRICYVICYVSVL